MLKSMKVIPTQILLLIAPSVRMFVKAILTNIIANMNLLLIQILRWLMQPKLWRFMSFASSVVALVCYALSSSFNHLFGQWNFLKIFLYTTFSSIICLLVLYSKIWQHSRSHKFKAHIAFLVLTITSVYSFFLDEVLNGKPDVYSIISCAAFASMSLGLSRQAECGFEVDFLYFFLACLIVQLMKIKLLLVIVGAAYSYCLVNLRSSFSSMNEYTKPEDENLVAIEVLDSPLSPVTDKIASMMEQLRTCLKAYSEIEVSNSNSNINPELLPSDTTINNIRKIAKRMKECGFEKVCSQVYSSFRKEILDKSLSRFDSQKLYMENIHKMPWLELEDEIKRWIKASNVAFKMLIPNERRLCDRVFFGFSFAAAAAVTADFSFNEICKESTIHLFNFADAVATGSGSPQRLFRIIPVFETMRDLIPEFETLFRDKFSYWLSNRAVAICNRLAEAIRGIFIELEYLIRRDMVENAVFPSGCVQPNTRYVVNYLRTACRSQRTLEQVFEDYGRIFNECSVPSSSSPLSRKMNWIMEVLEKDLEAKSKTYENDALCYGFLMSNQRYLVKMSKDNELGGVLGNDWILEHIEKVRHSYVEYRRSSWDKLLVILNLENAAESTKEKLNSFNILFEEICRVQLSWFKDIDGQLREEISVWVLKSLMPAYRNFIGKLQSVPELGKEVDKYIVYGTWDLNVRLEALFQGRGYQPRPNRRSNQELGSDDELGNLLNKQFL